VLASSSHLPHIRTLHILIGIHIDALATLSAICAFPFTHVDAVAVIYDGLLPTTAIPPLQVLLSLSTIRRIKLQCIFYDLDGDHFARLWDRASGILHVALMCDTAQ
jgi:hypothetical protein